MPKALSTMIPSGMRFMPEAAATTGDGNQRVTAITIDATQVSDADTADLTNFPVLITHAMLTTNASDAIDADGANPMQSDGGDLKFYSDVGRTNRLSCEVVRVSLDNNPALSLLEVWVLVPTVDYNDNTTIYMTYNSVSGTETQPAVGAAYGRNAVWADYEAVLHLDTSGYVDSTGNSHTGSATGTPTQTTTGHPWGGTWTDFVPTEYLTLASSTNMVDGGVMTAQAWHVMDIGTATTRGITSNDNNSEASYFRLTSGSSNPGVLNCTVRDDTNFGVAQPDVDPQTDPRLGAVVYTTGGQVYGQINTTRVTGSATPGNDQITNNGSIYIGSYNTFSSALSWDGRIGEVRYRLSALTEGWLSTEYNMGNAPGTFATAATPSSI